MGFDQVRWFVCHHQDPEEPSALPVIVTSAETPTLAIPLFSPSTNRAEAIAVMTLSSSVSLSEPDIAGLAEISTPLEVALERELLLRSAELKRQDLYDLAMRDTLTGLHNRLFLRDAAKRPFALHDRGDVPGLAVTMFDLDHFKRVNDTYGHAAGDDVLRRFATVLAGSAREGDVVARIGGEEFVALHVSAPDSMTELPERVRGAVTELSFEGDLAPLHLTVSAGVASRHSRESLDSVVARADAALYDAKQAGRDEVAVATE